MSEHGGPAFPVNTHTMMEPHSGMTLRDYFAAKAMQGLLMETFPAPSPRSIAEQLTNFVPEAPVDVRIAAGAYRLADAMIRERAKC